MDTNTAAFRSHAEQATEYMHDAYGLPLDRYDIRDGRIHVYANDLPDLGMWLDLTSGHITAQPAGHGLVMRTLHTHTDTYGGWTGIPLLVHVLTLADELVMPEITAATLRSTAA